MLAGRALGSPNTRGAACASMSHGSSVRPSTYLGRALEAAVYGGNSPLALRVPGAGPTNGVFWHAELNGEAPAGPVAVQLVGGHHERFQASIR